MERTLTLVLTLALCLSLSACGKSIDSAAAQETSSTENIVSTKPSEPPTSSATTSVATNPTTTPTTAPTESAHTHNWQDATCIAPKTCTSCGATEGSATGNHTYTNNKCTGCGKLQPTENLRYYLNNDQSSYMVWGVPEGTTELVIPSTNAGLPVTVVGPLYGQFLTSVYVPDSITTIGERSFQYCIKLTSIDLPASITSIGMSAFMDCNSLTAINFDGTVAQWNAIEKADGWFRYGPSSETIVEVICKDGKVSITN